MRRAVVAVLAVLLLTAGAAQAQTSGADPNDPAPFGHPVMDHHVYVHGVLDQLEGRFGTRNSLAWDGQLWIGNDEHRFRLRSEGFRNPDGEIEEGIHEALYARPITPYFDLQAGVRVDLDSGPARGWAALGIEGLAPLFFHVEATAYLRDGGHAAARLRGSYELLLTQQLILEPELELNFYSKADAARRIGAGLADLDVGLRLRYEISRKFAPYLGVSYQSSFAGTARFARGAGEDDNQVRAVIGLRAWF